jgi:hypothetical protein
MALIESPRGTPALSRARALRMLHDAAYHQAKAAIMRPIAEFQQMMETRTSAACGRPSALPSVCVCCSWVWACCWP